MTSRSLRFRFAALVLVGQLIVLSVGTVAAQHVGRHAITRQFDEALTNEASILASLLEQEGRHVGIELDETYMQRYFPGDEPDYFQLYYRGVSFGRSPALDEDDLSLQSGPLEEPIIWNEDLPDGRPGRFIGVDVTVAEVEPDDDGEEVAPAEVTIVLAKDRQRLEQMASLLLAGLLGGDALLLLLVLGVTWGVVARGLRPVRTFARQVANVDVHTLGEPLDPGTTPDELHPIVTSVNDLTARMDAILRAERRSASNMAHELMTPISELRALSEVALQKESDAAYRERALGQAYDISLQMGNLIEMVRMLSAGAANLETLPGEPIAVAELVQRVVGAFGDRADERSLQLDVNVNGEVVDCNREAILSVCNNLLGNAVEYTPEGGRIELSSHTSGSSVMLRFVNECADLSAEHLPHLTEPFWRLSASRTEANHHGLGLTIAQGMAALAGIDLVFRIEDGRFVAEASTRRDGTPDASS